MRKIGLSVRGSNSPLTSGGTPVLLSALIGHGWQGVVVQIIGLALATLVYIPFMIIANKQAEAEQASQN